MYPVIFTVLGSLTHILKKMRLYGIGGIFPCASFPLKDVCTLCTYATPYLSSTNFRT